MNRFACAIGSLPHTDPEAAVDYILNEFKGIPFWPQLPKYSFYEDFNVQYTEGLPAVVLDKENRKMFFDTKTRLDELAEFYEQLHAGNLDHFQITPKYAKGLHVLIERLQGKKLPVLKGHVTGGVSFAMNVNDREDRMLAYDENFFDMSVKAMTAKGLWQVKTLSPFTDELILFYDEPALVGFGSAFIQVTQEQITEALRYTVDQIQATGTKIGIHCCANTDWSLILNARPNILSFDAFSFFDNILVYADPLRGYLKAGGKIAFGIVPTNEVAYARTPEQLLERIIEQIDQISDLGIDRDMIVHHTLISPACGLGTTHNELAEQALGLAGDVADAFCDHYDI